MSKKWEFKVEKSELEKQLRIQLIFLRESCKKYDQGFKEEALRIASAAYTILHDNPLDNRGNSISIISQLGMKENLEFLTTCDVDYSVTRQKNSWRNPCGLCSPNTGCHPLITGVSESHFSYVPLMNLSMGGEVNCLPFKDWYEQPIFETWDEEPLTRIRFLLTMANQDEGRHVDPRIREFTYYWLSRGRWGQGYKKVPGGFEVMMPLSMNGTRFDLPDGFTQFPNAHYASMRQIGFEIEATFILSGVLEKWPAPKDIIDKKLPKDHPYRRLLSFPKGA